MSDHQTNKEKYRNLPYPPLRRLAKTTDVTCREVAEAAHLNRVHLSYNIRALLVELQDDLLEFAEKDCALWDMNDHPSC